MSSKEPGHYNPRSRTGRRLSIVAPVFNEQAVLGMFFDRLKAVLSPLGMDYEIICVNDGSKDHSLAILLAQHHHDSRIKVIDLARNFGKERALSAGLDAATGDLVVPIDVDLQDPPELIAEFLDQWEAGFDVVYGVRMDRAADTRLKRWTSSAFYKVFNRLSDTHMPPDAGDFRLMDRRVVEVLRSLPEANRFMKGLFAWVGFRQVGVPYSRPERAAGVTSWRYWTLWNFALDGILAFSSVPIRIWTYIGLAAGLLAIAFASFITLNTLLHGRDVPGYSSLAVMILLGFSLQSLAIGTLGEYISRIYSEVKGRPIYVVMDRYGLEEDPPREGSSRD